MDELMHSVCCIMNLELHWCNLSKEVHLERRMLAGCIFFLL